MRGKYTGSLHAHTFIATPQISMCTDLRYRVDTSGVTALVRGIFADTGNHVALTDRTDVQVVLWSRSDGI